MTETTTPSVPASIIPELTVIDGVIYTTSLQVAQHFNKRHDTVLRATKNLISQLVGDPLRNFAEGYYTLPETGDQQHPLYRITRDGFSLLAMGFTGKEALQWKITFLDTFNKMEAALTSGATDRISPAQAQHLRELVLLVVESGKQGHAETWSRLCRKMKVNKYELLHPSQFDAACEYLKGKMDDQSMAALVKKHFPAAVASLPAPEATIDVQALLLKGQDAEPVAIPPEVEQAIDKQAWILAHDAYALLREHMRKRMAYSHTKGYPVKTLDTRSALAAIKTLTLGAALAHTAHSEMQYALGAIRTALHAAEDAQARVQEQMAIKAW